MNFTINFDDFTKRFKMNSPFTVIIKESHIKQSNFILTPAKFFLYVSYFSMSIGYPSIKLQGASCGEIVDVLNVLPLYGLHY